MLSIPYELVETRLKFSVNALSRTNVSITRNCDELYYPVDFTIYSLEATFTVKANLLSVTSSSVGRLGRDT